MANIKSHGPLTVGKVTMRRKPALTYQSPAQGTAVLYLEKTLFTSENATTPPLSTSPPTRLSPTPEPSQRSVITHKSSRHHMTNPLLPLYHPFGTLALSLPDLDPTVFGLPAPVAVFDDPTRRASNRPRRPAAKVRDAEDPAASHPPPIIPEAPAPESEVKEKPCPRRRRGGKRKRKEPEDGDATYPAKWPRNPRSSGLSGARALSREEGSPALSNRTSPAVDAGRSDLAEEKKPERRTTRSRGAIIRRSSTASEDTATSASPSVTGANPTAPRVGSSGEPVETEEPAANDTLNEVPVTGVESQKVNSDGVPVPGQQES